VADALELESSSDKYDTVWIAACFMCSMIATEPALSKASLRPLKLTVAISCSALATNSPGLGTAAGEQSRDSSSFTDGWRIDSIEKSLIEITIDPEGACAWLRSLPGLVS